jgi:adhesin transport system outer membrane protein
MPTKIAVPPRWTPRAVMLENNPLLKQADADVEATRQYEAAKSRFYPDVNVEVGRTMDTTLTAPRHSQEWQAMLRMRYNLYNGGSDQATLTSYAYKMKEAGCEK